MKTNVRNLKSKPYLLRNKICFLLLCLIAGTFFSAFSFSMFQGDHKNISVSNPKASTTHPPIYIDGNAALDAFCAGQGTDGLSWDTAHVIEDLEINPGSVGNGIDIRNTDRFLIIRRCTIINSTYYEMGWGESSRDSGIYLDSVGNVKITECDLNNNFFGISLIYANYTIISDNVVSNSAYTGIWLETHASHNTISDNVISYNNALGLTDGISLGTHTSHNTISDNEVIYNSIGISLIQYSSSNTILGNTVSNNGQMGIILIGRSFNNTISGNTASHNGLYGIKTEDSHNNIIRDNNASYNEQYGIYLDSESDNNEVYQNIACHNDIGNINDMGENNDIHDNDECTQPQDGIPSYPIISVLGCMLCGVAILLRKALKNRKKM